jgi:hypothetical protein
MKKTIYTVMFGPRGQVACVDMYGEQIPELQESYVRLWAEHAEKIGYDPTGVIVESGGLPIGSIRKNDEGTWRLY